MKNGVFEVVCAPRSEECYATIYGVPVFVLFFIACAVLVFIISKVWPEE